MFDNNCHFVDSMLCRGNVSPGRDYNFAHGYHHDNIDNDTRDTNLGLFLMPPSVSASKLFSFCFVRPCYISAVCSKRTRFFNRDIRALSEKVSSHSA